MPIVKFNHPTGTLTEDQRARIKDVLNEAPPSLNVQVLGAIQLAGTYGATYSEIAEYLEHDNHVSVAAEITRLKKSGDIVHLRDELNMVLGRGDVWSHKTAAVYVTPEHAPEFSEVQRSAVGSLRTRRKN